VISRYPRKAALELINGDWSRNEIKPEFMGISSTNQQTVSPCFSHLNLNATHNREKKCNNSTRFGMIARWKSLEGVLQEGARRQATLGKFCPRYTQEINTNHPNCLLH